MPALSVIYAVAHRANVVRLGFNQKVYASGILDAQDALTPSKYVMSIVAGTVGLDNVDVRPVSVVNVALTDVADIYDPIGATIVSNNASTMHTGRSKPQTCALSDGRVFVGGGSTDDLGFSSLNTAEIFDPKTGVWTSIANMPGTRLGGYAVQLNDGRVLVQGGISQTGGAALTATWVYTIATNTWATTGSIPLQIINDAWKCFCKLSNGKILATGAGGTSTYLYDPSLDTWASTGSFPVINFSRGHLIALPNGNAICVAGNGGGGIVALASTAVYNTGAGTWSAGPTLSTARVLHFAILLSDGRILVTGGASQIAFTGGSVFATTEIISADLSTVYAGASLAAARCNHAAALLSTNQPIIAGGENTTILLKSAEIYTPGAVGTPGSMATTGSLSVVGPFPPLVSLSPLQAGVICCGGDQGFNTAGNGTSTTDVYNETTSTWGAIFPYVTVGAVPASSLAGMYLDLTLDRAMSAYPATYSLAIATGASGVFASDKITQLSPASTPQTIVGLHGKLQEPSVDAPNPLRDFANPQNRTAEADPYSYIPDTTSGASLAVYVVDDRGDYALDEGLVSLKKRIFRRLMTRPGAFAHAPTYGVGIPQMGKKLMSPANVQKVADEAQRQISREPEVAKVKVTAASDAANPNLIVFKILVKTVTGEAKRFDAPFNIG